MLEIILPADQIDGLAMSIEGLELLGRWDEALHDDQVLVRMLVDADHTESIMDLLEQRFGTQERFRLMLLPVEATLPRPPEPPPPEKADTDAKPARPVGPQPLFGTRISREELYDDIQTATKSTRVFMAMAILSAAVAAIGLLRDAEAIIIGAMVIAPLLGPNLSLALATTLGDGPLARRSIRVNLLGVVLVLGVSIVLGLLIEVEPLSSALQMRTEVGYGDIMLAAAAGMAGVIAFTTGVGETLIGVMVAVALVPPLVAMGLLAGSGLWRGASGAALLVGTNVICINLAAVTTFLLQGVRPRTWWEAKKAKRATRRAVIAWVLLLLVLTGLIWLAGR